jgi:5-methyltetrahydropteroyltriglutamate--homocysteine methyltransferase
LMTPPPPAPAENTTERQEPVLFATTLVGSYPQPAWLIDRDHLRVPRVRAPELWRVQDAYLNEAQDDATILAVRAQELAGLDIITDGEMRRESYSNRFATRLEGLDLDNLGIVMSRGNPPIEVPVPRIVGPIARSQPIHVDDVQFLRSLTQKTIKVTIPGPFTLSQQAHDDYYRDDAQLALAYAAVVRAEMDDLFRAGADIVQLDEPWMEARPDKARAFGVAALTAALRDAAGVTAVHICFGYGALVSSRPQSYSFLRELAQTPADQVSIETAQSNLDCEVLRYFPEQTIILGVLDLSTAEVESPEVIVERAERALRFVPPERLILAPDCGMKFLPPAAAGSKLCSMVRAAGLLRARYGSPVGVTADPPHAHLLTREHKNLPNT